MNLPRPIVAFRRLVGASASDIVFNSAALEILEAPPSPLRVALLLTICAIVVACIVVAFFFKVEIYAQATGRVDIVGRSKIVQPLEAGRVSHLYVKNGDHVRADETLLDLDATETLAERDSAQLQLQEHTAEAIYRRAAVAAAKSGRYVRDSSLFFPALIDNGIRDRELSVLDADLAHLSSTLHVFDGDRLKLEAQIAGLKSQLKLQEPVIAALEQRAAIIETLQKDHWESLTNLLDAQEALAREQQTQADRLSQVDQMVASVESLRFQREDSLRKFIDDNEQAAEAAEAKRDTTEQDLIKASFHSDRTRITAPVDGTVQELSVTTEGQIVTSGQQLLTIVPSGSDYQIEALVSSSDIGFVRVGQPAVIKVDTFPFTIYGTLSGQVLSVSRDAVDITNLHEALPTAQTATSPMTSDSGDAASTEQTRNLAFPISVKLDKSSFEIDGHSVFVSPGMTVTVEIITGKRRVLDYLLSPLREISSDSLKER